MKFAELDDVRELLVLVLSRLSLRFLSPSKEEVLARFLGDAVHALARGRRRAIASSLTSVLDGELATHETGKLTQEIIRNKWIESFSVSAIKRETSRQSVVLDGLERLDEALHRGKGVILWESPFGKRLLGMAALVERGYVLHQVHSQEHGASRTWLGQRVFRAIYRRAESGLFADILDIQDDSFAYLKLIVGWLDQNGIVCISGLGREGRRFMPVALLGVRLRVATGTVNLARMTGASIIPVFCFRDGNGADRLVLEKPIELDGGLDRDEVLMSGVTQYAHLLEAYIRKYPDQWYRWHRLPGTKASRQAAA